MSDADIIGYFGHTNLIYGFIRIYGGKYIFPTNIQKLFVDYYDNSNVNAKCFNRISNDDDIGYIKCKAFNHKLNLNELIDNKDREWEYNHYYGMFICLLKIPKNKDHQTRCCFIVQHSGI